MTLFTSISEEFSGSLRRVSLDGILGVEVAAGVFDPELGVQECVFEQDYGWD